ncbi:MAG: type II/IV secretion system ATPase subunit [Halobacteriota archaeon]|nr:type II/IV secretion system ATPase subunit [Halobacteriota archaeon]
MIYISLEDIISEDDEKLDDEDIESSDKPISENEEAIIDEITPYISNEEYDQELLDAQEDTIDEGELDRELFEQGLEANKDDLKEIFAEKLLDDFDKKIKDLQEKQKEYLPEEEEEVKGLRKLTSLFEKKFEMEEYNPEDHGQLTTFEGIPGYDEVERYWVNEPYAFVVILYDKNDNEYLYYMAEPVLSPFEESFLIEIKRRLQDVLVGISGSIHNKEKVLKEKVKEIIVDYSIPIEPLGYYKILYYIVRDYIQSNKISPLMKDSLIEDISCNGWNSPVFLYHKNYTNIQTNIVFGAEDLNSFIIRLAQKSGKHISVAEPMVDATMPDGSRIQMTLGGEITTNGSTFTIRKFKDIPITPIDLIKWNTFSSAQMAYLWLCIENNKSLIFSGGTASGKTSSLNAVSLFIPHKAKVITLEDTRELQLPHPNWIPGVTRDSFTADGSGAIDMYELLRAALRQRPEYLLVGEVRGKEALTLFQAMSTGHTTFSTMHADSVDRVIHRLENPPISVPRTMIEALDLVSVQAQTYSHGKRVRRNMALVEITEIDSMTKVLKTVEVYKWDPNGDEFLEVGMSHALEEIRKRRAWSSQQLKEQLKQRQFVLEYMVQNDITVFEDVATIIYAFQANPEKVLKRIESEDGGFKKW